MVYEAIVHGLLAFDYSPVCTSIVKDGQSRRLWLNVSHDARAAIDDLREQELVKALKTCSEDFQPSTAYQVTARASTALEALPARDKQRLDDFLTCPGSDSVLLAPHSRQPSITPANLVLAENPLLKITYDAERGQFRLRRSDGSVSVSRVTDIEEVSYVSSPYLPACLMRNGTANFSSNAWQADKCLKSTAAIANSSIHDADLSFAIVLENVRLMVGEWIPFGPNQIVSLNERLGSLERCQGGLFTSELDKAPTSTSLCVDPGLTKIAIVDFEFDAFTNFEADIYAPAEQNVVQIESFGMHLHGDGSIVYGMEIDATMDRSADFLCVDHLARLLVDVDLDSSKIINDLLSPHQRDLLDMLFMGDARSRNKFALLTASGIAPKLPAREYLDRGEKENELKQVLGELHSVHDIGLDDKLLVGREGMLLAGPNANRHEPLLVAHLELHSRELVVRFFFKRTFILGDLLARARAYMTSYEMNPEAMDEMRNSVSRCAHDLVMDSTRFVKVMWSEPAMRPKYQTWKELFLRVRMNWEQFIPPPVRTQATYDATHGLLIDVTIHAGLTTNCYAVYDQLMAHLESAGCFDENYAPPTVTKSESSPTRSRSRGFLTRSLARWNAPVHPTQEA
ncbi:hypothetical protein BBO99_00003277 [Phytophthora kernoviae]|uniref:Uncharacterized protein n=2 Tax=Phytophthora kernoviae TaxID=325452 RepID=A0A3R7H3B7_9STRA|nr:hypothetical protein G195_004844 [Phytophthora kernoviae 00238/432]KAG2525966.1 hypothetical protein JM16_004137 [Phytophthora kernoviae]KAG2527639.1 hypothetical protein JM18_003611 [Phytophthora kernoviae]RLN14177.1 hypothetical protein BBI17_004453 [Phytophthora kernoviae]RLN81945.1 hypothetical protein BBO99_00003277 [Phytophthora kernoviae]